MDEITMQKHVGRRLREAMDARKMSLIRLGKACNVSPAHLTSVTAGRSAIGLWRLKKVSDELDLPGLDWFIGNAPVPKSRQRENNHAIVEIAPAETTKPVNAMF